MKKQLENLSRLLVLVCVIGGTGLVNDADGTAIPGGTLDPTSIPKYVSPLFIPPAMPRTSEIGGNEGESIDYYEIAVRQFLQDILPPSMGLPTSVWSYVSVDHPGTVAKGGTFNYPALTIEATHDKPVRVKWINDLIDEQGNYLPHILPIDQTLHWTYPPGSLADRDKRAKDPMACVGPVPIVTHVHGAHTHEESDGYPEAWFCLRQLISRRAMQSPARCTPTTIQASSSGTAWSPGSQVRRHASCTISQRMHTRFTFTW